MVTMIVLKLIRIFSSIIKPCYIPDTKQPTFVSECDDNMTYWDELQSASASTIADEFLTQVADESDMYILERSSVFTINSNLDIDESIFMY